MPEQLGWREWVALPEFGVEAIKAKLDTGARTSSLHAFALRRFERDGAQMVRFEIHPHQRSAEDALEVEARVVEERWIRNSGGTRELRPVIVTTVGVGGKQWPIEFTLSRRDQMGFRMLLGRQALRGRALVDPGRSYRAGKRKVGPGSPGVGRRKKKKRARSERDPAQSQVADSDATETPS